MRILNSILLFFFSLVKLSHQHLLTALHHCLFFILQFLVPCFVPTAVDASFPLPSPALLLSPPHLL